VRLTEPESRLADYVEEARRVFAAADARRAGGDGAEGPGAPSAADHRASAPRSPDFEHLRWFPLPEEIGATSGD